MVSMKMQSLLCPQICKDISPHPSSHRPCVPHILALLIYRVQRASGIRLHYSPQKDVSGASSSTEHTRVPSGRLGQEEGAI